MDDLNPNALYYATVADDGAVVYAKPSTLAEMDAGPEGLGCQYRVIHYGSRNPDNRAVEVSQGNNRLILTGWKPDDVVRLFHNQIAPKLAK